MDDQWTPHEADGEVTMRKIPSHSGMATDKIRELTAGELASVTGGTILMVNGGGNSPGLIRPAEFVIINKV